MVDENAACYRHADVAAAVGCQRCGKPICSRCMTQASVGFHCPDCVKNKSDKVINAAQLGGSARPPLTTALIGASVVMFVAQFLFAGGQGFRSSFSEELLLFGPAIADGKYWQILTSGFLHADPIHIGFNMFLLWLIGKGVEHDLGKIRFALIYFSSLFAGSAFALAFNFAVGGLGASGAVLGMFGGVAGLLLMRGRSLRQIPGLSLVVINLVLPLIVPGISFWAHFGGVVGGFIAGALLVLLPEKLGLPQLISNLLVAAVGAAWFGAAVLVALAGGLT